MACAQTSSACGLNFSLLSPPSSRFGPRIGNIIFNRPADQAQIQIQTPGIITSTSRGVIPHLSQDNHRITEAVKWVNVPFETFLEHDPPVPTLQKGLNPLHTFLGYFPSKQLLSVTIRDPSDGREMPPNGNNNINTYSLRGVRKITPANWRHYTLSCKPDVVVALSDTPFTHPPHSQKRMTKSIDRGASWLADMLRPITKSEVDEPEYKLNVLVHMAGGVSVQARRAFAESLVEPLYGPELTAVEPHKCLDDGVTGYVFNLVSLRLSLDAIEKKSMTDTASPVLSSPQPSEDPLSPSLSRVDLNPTIPAHTLELPQLLQASLTNLPTTKLRVVHSPQSPHEILRLISSVGIDMFDAHWAQRAADIGISLDFRFPVPPLSGEIRSKRPHQKHDVGHNLYNSNYAHDFSALANSFRGSYTQEVDPNNNNPICPCAACSPTPSDRLYHGIDTPEFSQESPAEGIAFKPSHSRAYIHHLLHTHEMSAHSLLAMHNLSVFDAFFSGIRKVLSEAPDTWTLEFDKFMERYDERFTIFDEAKVSWKNVELARGKGRLAREKAKQNVSTLGTAIED